jgi:hypothetical protein
MAESDRAASRRYLANRAAAGRNIRNNISLGGSQGPWTVTAGIEEFLRRGIKLPTSLTENPAAQQMIEAARENNAAQARRDQLVAQAQQEARSLRADLAPAIYRGMEPTPILSAREPSLFQRITSPRYNPEAVALSERAVKARDFLQSQNNQLNDATKLQFASIFTGTDVISSPQYVNVDAPEFQQAEVRGAKEGSYDPYASGTFTLQNAPLPLTFNGQPSGTLPVAVRRILEKAYRSGTGATSFPKQQTEVILTGAPARVAQRAYMTGGTDEAAAEQVGWAVAFQEYQDAGIAPQQVDPYGVWANLVTNVATREALDKIVEQAKLESELALELASPGTYARLVPKKPTAPPVWKRLLDGLTRGRISTVGGVTVSTAETATQLLDAPLNYVMTAYYSAAKEFKDSGNINAALRLGTASLVARPFGEGAVNTVGGRGSANKIWAIDSREERAKLGVQSIGQDIAAAITGNPNATLGDLGWAGALLGGTPGIAIKLISDSGALKDTPLEFANTYANWVKQLNISAPVDFVSNFILDPTTYSPMVTSRLGKVLDVGADLAVRAEAAAVNKAITTTQRKFATASYSHLGYGLKTASKVRLAEIADEAAIRFSTAKGWVKPTSVLSDASIAATRRAGRASVINDTVIGRSYFQEVENFIKVNGTDVTRLKQTFRDWDNRLIQNVVQIARDEGSDAAMTFIRQAAVNGEVKIRITIRRQILATVEGYLASPGRQLGYGGPTSKLVSGHSVPFILGASPIKPFKGRTLRSFEKLAGRSNVWAPLLSKTLNTSFNGLSAGFDEIASRLAGQEKQLVADRAKDIEEQLLADGIPTDASGYAIRISRLVQMGTDDPDVIPGLDKLALALSANAKDASDEALGRAIRDLEVGVDIALSGNDEQLTLGAHLFASFAGETGPSDVFSAAQRRLNDIATVHVPRNQRFSDWLDSIITTDMPRRRQLDDWADVSDPKYSLPFTPRFKRPVATLREAIREIEAETNRLIAIKGKRAAIYDAAIKSREEALARVARAFNDVQTFAYRRAKHVADYRVKINTLKEFYDESLAPIKAEADKIKEEADYLAGRRAQLKEQAKYSGWVQRPSSIREDGKYTAKNLVFSSRESYDADTLDWISRKEIDLQARRAANRKAKRELETATKELRKEFKDDLDKQLNSEWINELEAQAADELAVARAQMAGRSIKGITFISKRGEQYLKDKAGKFATAVEQYAAIRQIDPDDISDSFIKNVVIAQRNIALNGIPQFPTRLEVVRRVAAARRQQIGQALSGQKLFGKVYNIDNNALGIMNRNAITARAQNLPDILREYFENKIVEAIGLNQFDITDIARDVERFASNPAAADAVAAEMLKESNLARWIADNARPNAKALARQNSRLAAMAMAPVRFGANVGLNIMESIAPKAIRFISHPNASMGLMNRLEDLDRVASDWGMDSTIRTHMKRVALGVETMEQLAAEISAMQRVWAHNMNVPYDIIRNEQNDIWRQAEIAFTVDADGKVVRNLQVLSQKSNNLIVMSADKARILARDYTAALTPAKAQADGVAWLGKGTVYANKIRQIPSTYFLPPDAAYTKFLKAVHPVWKGAMVTGAPTIFIGGAAGMLYGDPNKGHDGLIDRVQFALLGAMLGSLGGIRYIARVALIEERLVRTSLARGFGVRDWIPGVGKMLDSGLSLPSRHLDELVSSSAHPLYAESYNKLFAITDDVWDQIGPDDRFFIDAWARVVNRQLHPELGGNVLDRIILQNFDNPNVNWREAAEAWLTSPAGKNEYRKIGSIAGKKRSMESILDGYEKFITRYLPTPQIRDLRLRSDIENPIPLENFRLWAKQGIQPDSVHAQKTWILPRKGQRGQDAWLQARTYYRRFVMEKPTSKLNRGLMARNVYSDEFRSLIRQGVAPDVARDIAEERAVVLTNKVMFQLTDESRFAAKTDFFFPFQQPREELLRVYTSLVMENQARALRFTRLGATAFNNATSSGLFYEDGQGEWRMRVPGSAWLSRVFDAPQGNFDFKVRSLFFLLQGNAFSASGGGTDFNLGKPLDVFLGTMPAPGGPYWGMVMSAASASYPEVFEELQQNHEFIFSRLFPYGTKSSLVRPEAIRLWTAFSGSPAPWEFGDIEAQRNALVKVQQLVIDEMLYENRNNPNYIDEFDSPENQRLLKKRVSGLLLAWTVIGSITPAPARPIGMGFEDMEKTAKLLGEQFGEENVMAKMYELRPDIAPIYFARSTEANDKGSFTNWKKTANYDKTLMSYNYIKYLEPADYVAEFARGRKQAEIQKAYNDVYNMPVYAEADIYGRIRSLDAKYADDKKKYKIDTQNEYFARKALAYELVNYNADTFDNRINEWRLQYNVSAKDYKKWLTQNSQFKLNPFKETRDIENILYGSGANNGKVPYGYGSKDNEIREKGILYYKDKGGQLFLDKIKELPAAEQIKYWDHQISQLDFIDGEHDPRTYGVTGNAVATVNNHSLYLAKKREVYAANPVLTVQDNWHVDTPLESSNKRVLKENGAYLDAISDKIALMVEAKNIAYEKGDWSTYRSLKGQLSGLYEQRQTIRESLYDKFPDLLQLQKDMKAIVYLQNNPDSPEAKTAWEAITQRYAELGIPMLVFGAEERAYLNAPPQVRAAMKEELVERLNYEKGDFVVDGYDQKLYWENLTPFQRDLLENSPLPDETLEKWKSTSYASTIPGGSGLGESGAALAYAQSLMSAYNRRPKGAVAPAAYAEYRLIPASDTARRTQFLRDNEDVANWIRLGPLANMPPLDRILVINLMVKYGNWSGEAMSSEEMVNIAWADQQMQQWSRRGQRERPTTYDTWINMPTGVEKAEYLRAHPEVQQWIADGPMANMPDMYKDVVKAIMQQYGNWSASTDPLGETITQFYNTPKDLRADFLNEHPELREYWKALRSPEEQKIADLTEQYFSITDGTARRLFLSAHPELQKHFADSRIKKYERFLNQVSFYLGSNPTVFQDYLENQKSVTDELIARFGQKSLIRETLRTPGTARASTSTSGRTRAMR